MANPDNAETCGAPAAADFDGLAGSGQETDAVQTRTIFAEIHGVGGLGEIVALGIGAFDGDTKSLGNARLLAVLSPKIGNGLFEGKTDARFAVGVRVKIGNANFLLLAAAFMDEESGIADFELGFQNDEGAVGVDNDRFSVLVERAAAFGEAINNDGNAHGDALAGTLNFFVGSGPSGHGERWRFFFPGLDVVERGDFDDFSGNAALEAVFTAFEFPGLAEDLFKGFLAILERDPGVAIPAWARKPDGKISRHRETPQFPIIPVGQGSRTAAGKVFVEK